MVKRRAMQRAGFCSVAHRPFRHPPAMPPPGTANQRRGRGGGRGGDRGRSPGQHARRRKPTVAIPGSRSRGCKPWTAMSWSRSHGCVPGVASPGSQAQGRKPRVPAQGSKLMVAGPRPLSWGRRRAVALPYAGTSRSRPLGDDPVARRTASACPARQIPDRHGRTARGIPFSSQCNRPPPDSR